MQLLDCYRGTLKLDNWEFIHFFHDYTSLVEIEQGYCKAEITNCNFDKFSNCASIIRDTKEYPDTDNSGGVLDGLNSAVVRAIMEANILQQSDDVTVLCSSSDCASIMISGCTFINFNYLKSTFLHFQYLIDKTSVMKYQGLILSMSSFPGEILINRNTFENLRFKYSSCHISHNTNQTTSLSSLWNADVHQVKTLIRIETHSNVLIQGNTFTGCNSHSGLLHIERTHNQHPIIVKDNIFTRNSALSVANLIRIDLATDYDYSHPIPDHMPCSSILISKSIEK